MNVLTEENLKLFKKRSGIYAIHIKHHTYIGSSYNLQKRLATHISRLRNNKHYNSKLQNTYNKYSTEKVYFEILEECSKLELLIRESHYIITLLPDLNLVLDPGDIINNKAYKKKLSKKSGIRTFKTFSPSNKKVIYQYTLAGIFLKKFNSVSEASKTITGDFSGTTLISACALGKIKSALNFRWSYDLKEVLELLPTNNKKIILQKSKNGVIKKIWLSIKELTDTLPIIASTLRKYIDTGKLYKNYFWESYKEQDCDNQLVNNPTPHLNKWEYNALHSSKKCYQYSLNGEFLAEYPSVSEAARQLNIEATSISSVCRKVSKNKSAYGFLWSYTKEDKLPIYVNKSSEAVNKPVIIFDCITGKEYKYVSCAEAIRQIGFNSNFNSACATLNSIARKGGLYNNQFIARFNDIPYYILISRNIQIYNAKLKRTFNNAKEAASENNLSVWTIKKQCADLNNFEWLYVLDSARVKLRESGKLFKEKDNPNPSFTEM